VLLGLLGTDAPAWRFILYPIALILMMLLRPKGLLGTTEWGFFKPDAIIHKAKAILGVGGAKEPAGKTAAASPDKT